MILYFSGTENSEYIANNLRKILVDDAIDLFHFIKNGEKQVFTSKKPFVLVCPTYSWRVPRFLSEYLQKCEFKGTRDIYVVMNYGDSFGNAIKYIKANTKKLGLNFKGLYGIKMPENYLMLFELDSNETNRKIVEAAKAEILKAGEYIKSGKEIPEKSVNLIGKIESGLVNSFFFKFITKDKKFYYTDKCIKCGFCAQVCVLNNISYKDGHPVWNGNCTHCCACISKCPVGAIEYGKKTVNKERYLLSKIISK